MNKFSFSSSPAWSIGHRYGSGGLKRDAPVPGPGSYMLSRDGSRSKNGWKIGTSTRDGRKTDGGPGPGAYNIRGGNDAPKLSFGIRSDSKHNTNGERVPGPGDYNPKTGAVYPNQPGITLGSKYSSTNKDNMPGPGAYNYQNYDGIDRQPAAKIGTSKRDHGDRDENPGPGTYSQSRPFSAGPQYGFSKSVQKPHPQYSPGPGQYEVRHFLDQDGNRGVTLSSKYDNGGALHASETPGPGQYNLSNGGNRGKSPGVRIGTANRYNKSDTTTPGPGQYGNVRINNGPAIKIGSSVRGVMRPDLLSTPGPGSYDLNGMKGSGGITISGHKYAGNKDDIPGPGTYNPNSNATRDRPATAKIGTGKRIEFGGDENPGPGHYRFKQDIHGPKFAFTRQLRGQKNRNYGPGPADYEIPASIPNVPQYIMSSVHSASGIRH